MKFAEWLYQEEEKSSGGGLMGVPGTPGKSGLTPSTSLLVKNYDQKEKAAGLSGGPNVKTGAIAAQPTK